MPCLHALERRRPAQAEGAQVGGAGPRLSAFLAKGDRIAATDEAGQAQGIEARNEPSADARRELGESGSPPPIGGVRRRLSVKLHMEGAFAEIRQLTP